MESIQPISDQKRFNYSRTVPKWSLEVINVKNASIVWDELFPTDQDAYAEFERNRGRGRNADVSR